MGVHDGTTKPLGVSPPKAGASRKGVLFKVNTLGDAFMSSKRSLVLVGLIAAALAAHAAGPGWEPQLDVELVADGLVAPLDLTFAPDGSKRRFIVDQTGLVLILLPAGAVLPTPFLDIRDRVVLQTAFDERGLLALAFHPRFTSNGKLYVQYSAPRAGENVCVTEEGQIPADPAGCPLQYTRRVSEFTVSMTDANRVDPHTERVIFELQWPGRKHNGGGLAFGPDGMLYIGLGDAGFIHGPSGADDPFHVAPALLFGDLMAQDLSSLYGKILRLDVDQGESYQVPRDNPFAGRTGIPAEIYAWGFRNPFRISFDRGGDRAMYVSAPADTLFEAIYKVTRPGNYGWAAKEGTHCLVRTSAYAPPETIPCSSDAQCPVGPQASFCGRAGVCTCSGRGPLGERIQQPIIEYLNFSVEAPESQVPGAGFGRASVGGHRYRGQAIRWLHGRFVAGDFALNLLDGQILVAQEQPRAQLWTLRRAFVFDASDPVKSGFMKSIGEDADGELYAITGNFTPTGLAGRIWRIVEARDRTVAPRER
jgi:glucose/arabinose dehydrogenase